MALRVTTLSALAILLAGPAFAACIDQIDDVEAALVQAATGDAAMESDMPATQHQQEVLSGAKETAGAATGMAADGAPGVLEAPASEHQEQVTGIGAGDDVMGMLAEAKQQADAGNEDACMATVADIKGRLGMN